ncbi:hypothetical protein EV359DRAFT_68519 [Lentinula novae-zelandiae]|nr:hypothetical protein EV359DRAFT_68519 [Lentinula novae-zelandiae]
MQISESDVVHGRKQRHSDQSDFENTSPLRPATRKCATHAAHAIQCLYNSGVENSQVKSQTWVSSIYQHAGRSVLVDTASSNTQFLQSDNFEGRKGSLENLCAIDWVKVNKGGSTAEFAAHWNKIEKTLEAEPYHQPSAAAKEAKKKAAQS